MFAPSIRERLQAEGIDVTFHRDGTMTAGILKPREQSWSLWLRDRVRALPGVVVTLVRERPASDPYFAHNEVRFSLGTRPEFIHSVTAQQLETEGPNDEVAKAEGAVVPARTCDVYPGLPVGPGFVAPLNLVGRVDSGRAA